MLWHLCPQLCFQHLAKSVAEFCKFLARGILLRYKDRQFSASEVSRLRSLGVKVLHQLHHITMSAMEVDAKGKGKGVSTIGEHPGLHMSLDEVQAHNASKLKLLPRPKPVPQSVTIPMVPARDVVFLPLADLLRETARIEQQYAAATRQQIADLAWMATVRGHAEGKERRRHLTGAGRRAANKAKKSAVN